MGKHIGIDGVANVIDNLVDLDTQVDPDGDTLAVGLLGTVVVSFVQDGTEGRALQAAFHDHDTIEEAQACAAEMMDLVRHNIAEYNATATDSRSRVPQGLQAILEAAAAMRQPYPSGMYL